MDHRMKQPKPEPLPDYCELFTLEEWNTPEVHHMCIPGEDGSAYYSDGTSYYPEVRVGLGDSQIFTHVAWFNK